MSHFRRPDLFNLGPLSFSGAPNNPKYVVCLHSQPKVGSIYILSAQAVGGLEISTPAVEAVAQPLLMAELAEGDQRLQCPGISCSYFKERRALASLYSTLMDPGSAKGG